METIVILSQSSHNNIYGLLLFLLTEELQTHLLSLEAFRYELDDLSNVIKRNYGEEINVKYNFL